MFINTLVGDGNIGVIKKCYDPKGAPPKKSAGIRGDQKCLWIFLTYKMVRKPNVSPIKQIIKDDNVKECISIE